MKLNKILPFALLIAFLVNSMGYYFIFEIKKSIVKNEMRSIIENGTRNYTVVKVINVDHDSNFHRVDAHEILYNGRLFDVISEIRTGESATFCCIQDVKEEFLLFGFKKVCKNKQFVSLDDSLIKIALPKIFTGLQHTYFTIHKFPPYQISLNSRIIVPLNPPPEPFC